MKDFLRRSGFAFLAMVFILSSVVIVILSFVMAPSDEELSQNQAAQQSSQCAIAQVPTEQTLPVPETFTAPGDVSRLETVDIEQGSGREVKPGDCITVKYHGTLAKDGKLFDGNFDKPLALKMQIGVGQVIQGWDRGVIGMKEGGLRRLIIPSELAYGPNSQDPIPPNSDLVFVVKVLKVE